MEKLLMSLLLTLGLSTQLIGQSKLSPIDDLFRGTRVINGHSVEVLQEGEMEMVIGHRFGRLNGGAYELFGIDQATIRLGLDYAPKSWFMLGLGRSSLGKTFDGYLKVQLLRQHKNGGSPLALTAISTAAYTSLRASDPERPLQWQNRLAFTHQLLIARQVSPHFSIQLMPTVVHFNLVENRTDANDRYALGASAKYQLNKNLALTSEYYYQLPNQQREGTRNPIAVGIDINTGSHVFQLHFTNAAGMIEKQFISETNGSWLDGDIHFGFNMVRTFKLKGRRY
ncbi:MAG: hypothetical protein Sapg2KO_49180 [Saprospiraceae bacterium]